MNIQGVLAGSMAVSTPSYTLSDYEPVPLYENPHSLVSRMKSYETEASYQFYL
jgi:hypothetical protein